LITQLAARPWLIPLLFALVLTVAGGTSYRRIEASVREEIGDQLESMLQANVTAMRVWLERQRAIAQAQARDPANLDLIQQLIAVADANPGSGEALNASPAQARLAQRLEAASALYGRQGFGVLDRRGFVVAGSGGAEIGRRSLIAEDQLARVLAGETLVTRPGAWPMRDPETGRARQERSGIMLVIVPIPAETGEEGAIGVLGFGFHAEGDFTRILSSMRMAKSGETYAFSREGLMVSESRFDDQLRELGLIPSEPGSRSSLNLQIRDPGGDMTAGFVPSLPPLARPLTRASAEASQGLTGSDTHGYRDYRGVEVIGAWTWLPELELGVATEIDAREAYGGLYSLRRDFSGMVFVLVLAAVGMFFYSVVLARMRTRMDQVKELGRYRIETKIGEGGMGTVYRASHAMLRRPTAIKLLRPDVASGESLARFEREVQVCSELTHPNTIAIYDYGHTPEGIFYYAMEYLDGITVAACVEGDGPQSEARTLYVMKQVCAALAEAHALGVIHRDLKPANIMLCERGGLLDFVKVLDFGLVRMQDQSETVALTSAQSLTGTPLYMSPEAVEAPASIDVRSDVYQLGAIAYYLLVGRHVFPGRTVVEVVAQHLGSAPEPPSQALGRAVSPGLEAIVLRCLAKDRQERFADAGALLAAFEELEHAGGISGRWTQSEARDWWRGWRATHVAEAAERTGTSASLSGAAVDIGERLHRPRT